ncbi:transporter substrate-binding domain-containing protein [Ancylobacter defluvii]|uniref:Amino acid ABC transporter n=1 Tax=Ancylobacter defluvii TaxID=1282440 RepID=A0A9W6JVY2_9HYPH|nr:transporter substrate-binding domain-containing protein [Ancylobacter defluvii]MBS7585886.1 transporter substrate-binding domain-containing protein [Ancylobacter defluvii]GLK84262.1 amino acid ABC transporter [Ancylobacter defluvii]
MNRRTFLTATALAGLAGSFSLAGPAAADTLDDIKKRGKLLVAIDLGSPPFGLADAQMQPTGSDVESARLLAADLGVPLEIVQVTSPNRVPFLLTGKADIVMASFSVNEERKKVIDFSNAYGVIQIVVAAPKGTAIKTIDDLAGKRIGTTRGSTNDKEVTSQIKNAEIVRYDDDATLITALVSGQVDVMGSSPQVMAAVNQRRPNDPLETKIILKTNPYAIGLRKGDEALRTRLNEWIAKDLASGKLREIYVKYNGVPLPDTLPATN